MKRIFLFFLLSGVLSCQENALPLVDTGVVTGWDGRFCGCCGGLFVEIGNDKWRIIDAPDKVLKPFQGRDDFPITVKLIWERVKDPCIGDEILVKAISEVEG